MSAAELRHASSPSHTYLLVPILLLFGLLTIATLRAPNLISNVGIGSAVIVASPLILATYALTVIAMAGRVSVDLSIGPLIGFINVSMVQLYAAKIIVTPVEFFAYAIAVGVLYQLLMGLIIVYVRVQPIIVALSGFLALVGLNLVILRRPGGVVPEWMQHWGLGTEILSPVLAIVVVATLAWFALTRTAFFGHLRLMGSDERTAYASGVRINVVRLGAHVIAGIFAAMAALTFTSLIASGDPNQGTTYTLMAVTALVLGGTSLAGGRGSIVGSLFGALNIYLITYVLSTFSFGRVQSFVTEAAYGAVLVISLLLTLALPRLPQQVARVSPFAFFAMLGVLALGVILYSKEELKPPPAPAQVSGQTKSGGSGIQSLGSGSGSSSGSGIQSLGSGSGSSSGSGIQSLGSGSGGSGLTVLGGGKAKAAPPAPKGTPVVFAGIVIAVVVFLIYLLYRGISASLIAFIGVLALLVLGLSLYGGPDPPVAAGEAASSGMAGLKNLLLEWVGPYGSDAGYPAASGALTSPIVAVALVIAGTVLLASLLILIAQTGVRSRIGNVPLLFAIGLGAAAAIVVVYANQGVSASRGTLFTPALCAVLVGALLFVVSLPRVQQRIGNTVILPLAVLSVTALGAMYFAAGPGSAPPAPAAPAAGSGAAVTIGQLQPSESLLVAVFWVILAAAALYIGTLPLVRNRIFAYVAESVGVRVFSYSSAFIVLTSILFLGAMFYAAEAPLWKLGVAIVAAVIVARRAWKFLRGYRGGRLLSVVRRELGGRGRVRMVLGAGR
ncbi:MAG: ABC transporter permease [Rhodospirillaceae bacterium]|nr:ABC transporter permease [Rhodospirillaceae bacterium]